MNLGQRLTALRHKKHITQDQISDILGVKRARYNAWENSISNPDYEHLAALAKFHNVTVDFLLGLPHQEKDMLLTSDMYADGYTEESVLEDLESELRRSIGVNENITMPISPAEQELVILYRKTDDIPESEREKLKNTIADTIELYLSRTKKD